MYKVFFNDRRINFTSDRNITYNQSSEFIDDLNSSEEVKKWFLHFAKDNSNEVFIFHPNVALFFREVFIPTFKILCAAGGVVFKNKKMLVIFRNGKWDLPKGKIDKGESTESAALREVQEECGITGHEIVKKLDPTFHIYQSPYKNSLGEWILKETFWFEMKYSGKESGTPQVEENISEIKWIEKSELDKILFNTYENLKEIFLSYRD